MAAPFAAAHESAIGTGLSNGDVRIHGEYWRVSGPSSDVRNPGTANPSMEISGCRGEGVRFVSNEYPICSADLIGQRSQCATRLRLKQLLVNESCTHRADHLILRPGAARATNGSDDLAVLDQRD